MHEKNKYRHIPWNRYNLEKYRDINFWSYRQALAGLNWLFETETEQVETETEQVETETCVIDTHFHNVRYKVACVFFVCF